jgi:hypothetical protein
MKLPSDNQNDIPLKLKPIRSFSLRRVNRIHHF